MPFTIVYSPAAVEHITALQRAEQVMVIDKVELQLTHQPMLPTRKRKLLRPNPLAPWQLRLDDVRVFYEVQDEPAPVVNIKAIGKKIHNVLWIGGEKIVL